MPSDGPHGAPREKTSTFLMPESQADLMKIQQRRAEKKLKKAEKKEAKKLKKVAKKAKTRRNSRSASESSEVDQVDHQQPLVTGPSPSQLETMSQARLDLSLGQGQEGDHHQESEDGQESDHHQESEDGQESKVEDEEEEEEDGTVVPNR